MKEHTKCEKCGAYGVTMTGVPNGVGPMSFYCKHHIPKMFRETNGAAYNPYDITLDHIYDERGEKVHVKSMKEMLDAEKKYNFRHVVTHYDDGEKQVIEEGNEPVWAKNKVKQPRHGKNALSHTPISPVSEEQCRILDDQKQGLWEYLNGSGSETQKTA